MSDVGPPNGPTIKDKEVLDGTYQPHLHNEPVLPEVGQVVLERLVERVSVLSGRRLVHAAALGVVVGVKKGRALVRRGVEAVKSP